MTFCSNCGNEVKQGLNYCNRCGGKIQGEDESESTSVAKSLATSLGYIGAAGFGVLIGIIAILTKSDIDPPALVAVIAFYLVALFGICFSILQMIPKVSGKRDQSRTTSPDHASPAQLDSPTTNQLEEAKVAPASVVENTTRTLDKVPIERK
ncbi:MAG: zinc ribbon domain-containing protein [Pyrinomonadaceae bacterium]|nr:zinc ribbon domain-containing protein [Pyrinomonadaceae bacterium]